MVNQEIAAIFNKMAAYLEMNTDQKSFFRARALKKAAEIIDRFPHDLAADEWHKDEAKLKSIEGIGDKIAQHIKQYVTTGNIPEYESLKNDSPVKLEELLKIQGVGPKKILKLYKELQVIDIQSLEKAAQDNKIADLAGFGKKSQDAILESIKFAILHKDRVLINVAEEQKDLLMDYLKKDKNIKLLEYAGSLRRKRETIGDIDFLACSTSSKETMDYFINYPNTEKVLSNGETKSSLWLKSKIQVDLRLVNEANFGAALQYFTGSKEHNVTLRSIAIDKGYKLSEYGLFKRDNSSLDKEGELIEARSEEKIYNILGLDYVEPELRENTSEFAAARNHTLPNLIDLKDIKGDLHMHTTSSDGQNTVEEMATYCKELGYDYIGITDHFGNLKIANAVDPSRLDSYLKSIKSVNIPGLKIYAGCEVEVDKDGNLEFNDEYLKQLDFVIASIHLSTKMSKEEMTNRIIKTIRNPVVTILGHPTGRLIGTRPSFEFDFQEVFKICREENVALEVNAHPMRLDLPDYLIREAIKAGCKISINTDSHAIKELNNMKYGVYTARRGWCEKKDLLYFSK